MSSSFAEPATPEGIKWEELKGSLLIVTVAEVVNDIQTNFGPTSAIRATVSVVDGPHAGDIRRDTLVFPKVLQGQLRPNVGRQVLGRLGQGQAKPSQSPPWTLLKATNADLETAAKFLADHAASQLTADDI